MSHSNQDTPSSDELTIKLTPEMREILDRLARDLEKPIETLARELLSVELKAQVGSFRDKFLYRM